MVLIEARHALVDGIDDDEPRGNRVGCRDHALERFGEQRTAEPLAMQRSVERKACEQHSGDLERSATTQRARQLLPLQEMCAQRVVGQGTSIAAMPDERARRPPRLSASRVFDQPLVKLGRTAVELGEPMSLAQLLGDEPQAAYRLTMPRARFPARVSAGLGWGVCSSAASS